MSGKSQADYVGVFEKRKAFMEEDGNAWNIKSAMVDYELALRNALKKVFNGIKLQGCWFHYCQAIYRKVRNLKLDNIYIHKDHGGKYIKRLMTLALMRYDMIPLLFDYMKKGLNEDKADMTPAVSSAFDKLFAYVETQWICNTKIPPSEWSVFLTNVRTNNEVENWNGKIWKLAGLHSLHLYALMKLLKEQADINVQKMSLTYSDQKKAKQKKIDRDIEQAMKEAQAQSNLPVAAFYKLAHITVKEVLIYNVNSYQYTADELNDEVE